MTPPSALRSLARSALVPAAAILWGCSALAPDPGPARYVCEDGRRFSVVFHADRQTATIDIDRMQFGLRREPSASGTVYGCDVLTLRMRGAGATVEIQGDRAYSNCRVVRD